MNIQGPQRCTAGVVCALHPANGRSSACAEATLQDEQELCGTGQGGNQPDVGSRHYLQSVDERMGIADSHFFKEGYNSDPHMR